MYYCMTSYYAKYKKYKYKYNELTQNNGNHEEVAIRTFEGDHNGNNHVVVHVAGAQGAGKTTMGHMLSSHYGTIIYVKDLDDLRAEYYHHIRTNIINENANGYQQYIDDYVDGHCDRPLVFVGLDASICLGPTDHHIKKPNNYYNLHAKYKYYIDISQKQILQQRFYRQIDKLTERREMLFGEYLRDPKKIQDKLNRFVNITDWQNNNIECNQLYLSRNYKLLSYGEIFDEIKGMLNMELGVAQRLIIHVMGASGSGKTTLGDKLRKYTNSKDTNIKDTIIIDTDDIDDNNILKIVNDSKYDELFTEGNIHKVFELKDKWNQRDFKKLLDNSNNGSTISNAKGVLSGIPVVIVGMTISIGNVTNGYFIDSNPEDNFRQLNSRTLQDIYTNYHAIGKLFDTETNVYKISMLLLIKYKIRLPFHTNIDNIQNGLEYHKKTAKMANYKIMTIDNIYNNIIKLLTDPHNSPSV